MTRPTLPAHVVARIRRERYAPRPTQPDFLHLAGLRRALAGAFAALPPADGPALDLYCGTQPYRGMIPRRQVIGVDRDRHFGAADVVAGLPLPFADGTFSLVVCTQALHLVDDPPAVVREVARVLAPGGVFVATLPHLLRREVPQERMLSAEAVRALLAGWTVTLHGIDGPGGAAAFYPASLALGAARRWPALRPALPPLGLALTAAGAALDLLLLPASGRWPACWLVVARPDTLRPAHAVCG